MGSQLVVKSSYEMNGHATNRERNHGYNRNMQNQRGGGRQYRRYNPRYNKANQNGYSPNYYSQQPRMEQYPSRWDFFSKLFRWSRKLRIIFFVQFPFFFFYCRLLIPSHMIKVILGKGGSTITSIQSKTNTKYGYYVILWHLEWVIFLFH